MLQYGGASDIKQFYNWPWSNPSKWGANQCR